MTIETTIHPNPFLVLPRCVVCLTSCSNGRPPCVSIQLMPLDSQFFPLLQLNVLLSFRDGISNSFGADLELKTAYRFRKITESYEFVRR